MSIEVYPQLRRLLAERGLTEEALSQQIRERFGVNASVTMVTQLAQQGSLHAANIEVAVAIVQVLGISLDDLFLSVAHNAANDEQTGPLVARPTTTPSLNTADNQPVYFKGYTQEEIASLLDDQTYSYPGTDNQEHIDNLIDEYGRALYDRHLAAYASERGITIEQARVEVAKSYAALVEWQHTFESDPERQKAVSKRAQQRRTTSQP